MNAKMFSYKVEGVKLSSADNLLKISDAFDRKVILEDLKKTLKDDNYKIDESSLNYKLIDDQLFIQGLAVENEEPRPVGFRFGK